MSAIAEGEPVSFLKTKTCLWLANSELSQLKSAQSLSRNSSDLDRCNAMPIITS